MTLDWMLLFKTIIFGVWAWWTPNFDAATWVAIVAAIVALASLVISIVFYVKNMNTKRPYVWSFILHTLPYSLDFLNGTGSREVIDQQRHKIAFACSNNPARIVNIRTKFLDKRLGDGEKVCLGKRYPKMIIHPGQEKKVPICSDQLFGKESREKMEEHEVTWNDFFGESFDIVLVSLDAEKPGDDEFEPPMGHVFLDIFVHYQWLDKKKDYYYHARYGVNANRNWVLKDEDTEFDLSILS